MDEVAVYPQHPPASKNGPAGVEDVDRNRASDRRTRAALAIPHLQLHIFNYISLCSNRGSNKAIARAIVVLGLATTYFGMICGQSPGGQPTASFNISGTSYECGSNMICLGEAHIFGGDDGSSGILPGMLSLINTSYSAGIAYYHQPVKFTEPSSQQTASFSSNFTVSMRQGYSPTTDGTTATAGDGMTFVITANNSFLGAIGGSFGIFDDNTAVFSTPFKSIVVELDTFLNSGFPVNDISNNHVSFDFSNITAVAAANASNLGVDLSDGTTKYVWVDYSAETQKLEVRVSYSDSRPVSPLLSYAVNLYDYVNEYMWVGFSSASGGSYSNFYIGDWTFASYGIPPPIPVDIPFPAPLPVPSLAKAKPKGSNLVGISVGSASGVLALILACVLVPCLLLRIRSGWKNEEEEDFMLDSIEGMPQRFTYKQLSLATRGFADETKLGQGRFGSVHLGVLPVSGVKVAIKKTSNDSKQGEKELMAEVSIISQLRHRNLILLQGWCKNTAKKQYLLVYELMSNGSLDKALFASPESGAPCLSWAQRFNIITGVASALHYLHEECKQQVIHRDIKSSNIMLDDEWNAKLGDFGLARLVDHQRVSNTIVVTETRRCVAPEAIISGIFTEKTDVFAFGAVVLEIACGRQAALPDLPPEEVILVEWVRNRLNDGALLSTVDKRLNDYDQNRMEKVLMIGLLCSQPSPLARPSMRHVVQLLSGDVSVPLIPTSTSELPFGYDVYWQKLWRGLWSST